VTALLLKLTLTPALIGAATLVGRRFGPSIGGAVVGLPLTSAPVSVFLALEHGARFAAGAAVGTLLGLIGQAAFCLAFAWVGRRTRWPAAAAAGLLAFLATTVALSHAALATGPAFVLVSATLLLATACAPTGAVEPVAVRPPAWELPLRMITGAAIVAVLTGAAGVLGPRWTGLLSPLPVFGLVLGAFTHRRQGPRATAALLRGIIAGSLSHATMFVLIAVLLEATGVAVTYGLVAAAALLVNAAVVVGARRQDARLASVG
jgi:hypothetical protein